MPAIIGSAVWLAIGTALVGALAVHWLFGTTLAFALVVVALATPTDATVLDGVIVGRKLSHSVHKTLRMEALFNDATGIVLLQAGLIWLKTGHLSFWTNAWALVLESLGGIIIGIIVSTLIMSLRQMLVRSTANAINAQNLMYLLTPFIVYLIAEALGVSGIIAVVSAGLISNSETTRSRFSSPRQMHFGLQLMNFASSILNSFVFVVLGISLARIATGDQYQAVIQRSWLWLALGAFVYAVLVMARFVYARFFVGDRSSQNAVQFALGGVHGTVTLAMTFSIATSDYALAVIVETVVIILSMLVPTILFKLILPLDGDALNHDQVLDQLRHDMVHAGASAVAALDLPPVVAQIVDYDLRDQVQKNGLKSFYRQWGATTHDVTTLSGLQSVEQRRALMTAFAAERAYLYDLAKRHVANSDDVYDLYSELLLAESLVLDPQSQVL
jgi:monovalent cation/hydrogen antiporter